MRNKIMKILNFCLLITISSGCIQKEKNDQRRTATDENSISYAGSISPFRLNHVGFLPDAKKFFVVDDPPGKTFQLLEIENDVKWNKVYEGQIERKESEMPGEWTGEFSLINKPGMYKIKCGKKYSRPFQIHEKVYDVPQRMLLTCFTWQRCGSKKGWAGECHMDDGIIKETGEHKDFSGGYHQSCDLRKSLDGVAIGVIGMIKYALSEKPHWDDGIIAEEIKWACDYYMKVIHPDGYMHDGLFVPFGWDARYYYNTPAAPSEQWNSIRLLALGAQYFNKHGDKEYADKCLASALRVWNFMISDARPKNSYKPPVPIPRGMENALNNYFQVYKGSADDIDFQLSAAAELYRASKNLDFLEILADCANRYCKLQIGSKETLKENPVGAYFWEHPDSARIASMGGSYTTLMGIGLCQAIELLPDRESSPKTWKEALEKIVIHHQSMARRNIWGQIPYKWVINNKQSGYLPGGSVVVKGKKLPCFYTYGTRRSNSRMSYQGILLVKAARILNQPGLKGLAQRQADWILGANPYDGSSVTGVGFNQPYLPMFGQFFPHTPQIPGAVIVGIPDGVEYDMPCTGNLMWLLSELSHSGNAL
jgi:hypothetical protein